MGSSGDNYVEGCLDSEYITGFGGGVETIVSNTDTAPDTENGLGYGRALLAFANDMTSKCVRCCRGIPTRDCLQDISGVVLQKHTTSACICTRGYVSVSHICAHCYK
jgi:hypothetical protein